MKKNPYESRISDYRSLLRRIVPAVIVLGMAAGGYIPAQVDGVDLRVAKGVNGEVLLDWAGGAPTFEVFRSELPASVVTTANRIGETLEWQFVDMPQGDSLQFYRVRTRSDCFIAIADAVVRSDDPDNPLGNLGELLASNDSFVAHAFLRFQLDSIPSGSTIVQATLWLQQSNSVFGTSLVSLHGAMGSWLESSLTWNTSPGFVDLYDEPVHAAGTGPRSWDATAWVQAVSSGQVIDNGLVLEASPNNGVMELAYMSRETGAIDAPRMCIEWSDPQQDAFDALTADSQIPPSVRFIREFPVTVDAEITVSATDPVEAALEYLETYKNLYRLSSPTEDLFLARIVEDYGRSFVTLGLRRSNERVRSEMITVEVEPGMAYGSSAWMSPDQAFPDSVVQLTPRQAIDAALAALPAVQNEALSEPSLEWFNPNLDVDTGGTTRLAWRVAIQGVDTVTGRTGTWIVHVDAETGGSIREYLEEITADRPGEDFDIEDVAFSVSSSCWDSPFVTVDDEWFDEDGSTGYPGAASDSFLDGQHAYDYSHLVYHYYYDTFGRRSWDGDEEEVEVMVHVGNPSGGRDWNNASYNSGCDHVKFGNGWVTRDVFGHEFTHGLIASTSELRYENQSGALNESYADFFGAMQDGNWIIGEDLEGGSFGAVRDMSNPPAFSDPDHMNQKIPDVAVPDCGPGGNDCGAVHTNSGIPNKVAFLIADGGFHNGLTIGGIGTVKAERLLHDVVRARLNESSQFINARDVTVAQARRYWTTGAYGVSLLNVCDVINAYASVGLGNPDTDCDGYPNAPTDDGDGDGVADGVDNCPLEHNRTQADQDGDLIGDRCDPDRDGDGVTNADDNCPETVNPGQEDSDGDGRGNPCNDFDGDTVIDIDDNCPADPNAAQGDVDLDGEGDVCDSDIDGDAVPNGVDECPRHYDPPQLDVDGDGVGDVCDNCINDSNFDQVDTDRDGEGNACDIDDDGDGVDDVDDNCSTVYNPRQMDNDADGVGLFCDETELDNLDGLRLAAELSVLFDHLDLATPIRIPVFPCRDATCPNRLPAVQNVAVHVDLAPAYGARIVDSYGHTVSKISFSPDGKLDLHFPTDHDYFYRDGATGVPFKGRSYFLELQAPPGSVPGTVAGIVRVTSSQQ
ncbi:MAG: M4 family metallopeptidase [Acidobacteria bacterium]|uniref:M4 family metallopeptidase n=1 Tax=Candidatus Polarisedimenticola svalbardensis TaxID=2886004 RepID=A0A8J6XY56_9BACT|nr:M4 family metallopeptidase [Candidatus Polarisedimenticola svalbardensis]